MNFIFFPFIFSSAILIIVIVAVILYSMGIFNPSSSLTATITGFTGLGVTQAVCINSVNNQILGIYISNGVVRLEDGLKIPMLYKITATMTMIKIAQP